MIDVKEAVKRACDYFESLYAQQNISGVLLEEVELTEDERYWLITLGYNALPEVRKSLHAKLVGASVREYKVFKVMGDTGKVVSMKIRRVA